jgi:hypothetical protein
MTVKSLFCSERAQFGYAAVKLCYYLYKSDTLCSRYPLIGKPGRVDTYMFKYDIDQFESVYGFEIT